MSPTNKAVDFRCKRVKITLDLKREIIDKREQGMSVADLARSYNRTTSTICTILKNKEKIKETRTSKGVTRITSQRSRILDDVENLLLLWINEKLLQGDAVNEKIICQKAKLIFTDLVKNMPGSSTTEEVFKASRGWFEKFKRRSGIHSVVRHGVAANCDAKAAKIFKDEFSRLVDLEGFLPQQIFSCYETGIFWKKMPKLTYIKSEENALPGYMKDRLMLLFCANASGDLKIKPLLVYNSESASAFKKFNIQKDGLNVIWRSNDKPWITHDIFIDWINVVFGPSVKKYLTETNLPLHVLLLLDNKPAHPPNLQNDLLEEFKFIKIQFLPLNTTALLQPMDQEVISNFKKLYTKLLFEHCFEVIEGTNLTLKEFWKDHFHILTCFKIIDKAWKCISQTTLISAWKKLWPGGVIECDSEKAEEPLVNEIVSLANKMGLEVDTNDIEELIKEHSQELTTEELSALQCLSEQGIGEILPVEKKEKGTEPSSSSIKEMLAAWETVASFVEKHHPDEEVARHVINFFNYNIVSYFEEILRTKAKDTG